MPSKQRHKEQHEHCEMELRVKDNHIGMYCKEHGQWIQWIKKDQLPFYLEEMNLEFGER